MTIHKPPVPIYSGMRGRSRTMHQHGDARAAPRLSRAGNIVGLAVATGMMSVMVCGRATVTDQTTPSHPMQPVVLASDGVIRFHPNAIINYLFETGALDLNTIAIMAGRGRFSEQDQMQIAQLLGYSVSGYGDLSYVSDESFNAADEAAQHILDGEDAKRCP
jgi:hypothetical protein